MSGQPTPETDALWQGGWNHTELFRFSRKLERERDEAREALADALQEVDLRTLDFERMKQERDEARNECKALWFLIETEKKKAYNALRERDEALSRCADLSHQILLNKLKEAAK